MRCWYVYLLASSRNGTLYCGVTNNLERRIWQHKNGYVKGFTSKYGVRRLVWFDTYRDVNAAILQEKRLRRWRRSWNLELIERQNPDWNDLYSDLTASLLSSRPERSGEPGPSV